MARPFSERSPDPAATPLPSLPRRLAWFAALWLTGVVSVAIVGLAIKLVLDR